MSSLLFSIPAVKGVEFGAGFRMCEAYGSETNDPFVFDETGAVKTASNNNGGILGGITNGMPLIFRTAIKPTASIYQKQQSVSLSKKESVTLQIQGRHDPCIVPRAVPVVEAVAAIAATELVLAEQKTADRWTSEYNKK